MHIQQLYITIWNNKGRAMERRTIGNKIVSNLNNDYIIEKIPKEISGNSGEKNFPGNSREIPGKILR